MNTVKEAIFTLSPFIIIGIAIEIFLTLKNGIKYKHVETTYTPPSLKEMFSDYQRYSQRAFNLMYYSLQLPKEALVKNKIEWEIKYLSIQARTIADCIRERMYDP